MSRGSGNEWYRQDQGSSSSSIPVHFTGASPRRSSGYDNLVPRPGPRPTDWQYNSRFPASSVRQSSDARFGAPTGSDARFGAATGTRLFEERIIATANPRSGLGYEVEQYPPAPRIFNNMPRETGPRMLPFHQQPPPLRLTWVQDSTRGVQARDDFNKAEEDKALKMLKKKIYGSEPKNLARRLSSFYKNHDHRGKEADEDSKRCAVCLDDFEAGTEVLVTPCNHMFHGDCILPWVRSNGQCPVCRFVISEPIRSNAAAATSRSAPMMVAVDDEPFISDQVLSFIVAMEEAFSRRGFR